MSTSRRKDYRPPFPWFGGKSSIADRVWDGLGNCVNYVEPFFGSGAVLMLRPGGAGAIETVNDADGLLANFWRAIQHDSDAVAEAADWPVSECDLHARHLWLLGEKERITDRLCGDPEFYDAKAAGWWVWGIACWIAGGWCAGNGPWISKDGKMVRSEGGSGAWRQLPHLRNAGMGVNRQLPHLGSAGSGVNRPGENLKSYLREFADRMRRVRVCCGDWSRVCGPSVTFCHGMTGVFLDPPYADTAGRNDQLYSHDSLTVAHDVREWAIDQGRNPLMRIVLAGYEGEHEMPGDWRVEAWKASGGYGRQGDGAGRANAHKERLWFSPACIDASEPTLFGRDKVMPPKFKNNYNADGAQKRHEARERAGNRCIRCGSPSVPGRILTTHHFDGDKANDEWWNLLALCQVCHLHIQGKVDPEQPLIYEHSAWIKPYVAGFYAKKYEKRLITRREAEARLDELLRHELFGGAE